jgi:hypothetical protein
LLEWIIKNKMRSGDISAEEQPTSKRPKLIESGTIPVEPSKEPPQANSPSPVVVDQVSTALGKIANHISNPKKFLKAASLLLELLSQPSTLSSHHTDLLFNAMTASMTDTKLPQQPDLSRSFAKLFHTILHLHPSPFNPAQQRQLDVYGILTVTIYALSTDDSFDFNKAVTRIKSMIEHLPSDEEKDDGENKVSLKSTEPHLFWSRDQALSMTRSAVLDCIDYARGTPYKSKPWTRTSIDILVEHVDKHRDRFPLENDKARIDDMVRFVREQRVKRKQGSSVKDSKRDVTSFEQNQKEWAGKSGGVSNRKAVGSGGDQKVQTWLG